MQNYQVQTVINIPSRVADWESACIHKSCDFVPVHLILKQIRGLEVFLLQRLKFWVVWLFFFSYVFTLALQKEVP